MSHKVITYILEHGDSPERGDYLQILSQMPDPTQFYYRKTHAKVAFPIFPRQYCVYHLAMSHFGEPSGVKQLGLFKKKDEAVLFAKQQFALTMGTCPQYRVENAQTGRVEWKEMDVIMNSNMKSELILAEDCHNYLVIISASHFEAHSLSRSTLWS